MSPQQTIAHYRITAKLGEGGMGEVWRAFDTKLHRDVALKILPEAFANNSDRMARFEREAQVLASLNHPNIAAIYGVEERAIVMELVEGETLHGPLQLDTALPIVRQIAEALEYAHEKGVVHRDLKPANIKVTPEGRVKVLDFGLAKALSSESAATDPTSSPTLTMRATLSGVIMGTAGYMSPEQARGGAIDKRADIWSFGVVLYELLTGRHLFTGDTVSDTLAAVLKTDPDWLALPRETPQSVRRLLRRCLERDRKRRLPDIGSARLEIDEALAAGTTEEQASATARKSPWSLLPWAITALTMLVALWLGLHTTRPVSQPFMQFSVELGPDAVAARRKTVAISPDGRRLVFPTRGPDGKARLSVRQLNQPKATPLAGTENATDPFFSPDGEWIGFLADFKLKKIAVSGGAAITLCEVTGASPSGAAWGSRGTIILGNPLAGLMRVSEDGGTLQQLTNPEAKGEVTHRSPQILPGGEGVLFTTKRSLAPSGEPDIALLSLKTGQWKTVYQAASLPQYFPSGHLVFLRQGTLFGVRFDPVRGEAYGAPVPLLEDVLSMGTELADIDYSPAGIIVYMARDLARPNRPIVWLDRDGKTEPFASPPGGYRTMRLSPNGALLAVAGGGVSVYDPRREVMTPLTSRDGSGFVTWAPDSRHIVYAERAAGGDILFWIRAEGGDPQRLLESKGTLMPYSFSPAGDRLAYAEILPNRFSDIWTVPLDITDSDHPRVGKPELFLSTPNREFSPAFSPDERWIAYQAGEVNLEVYVRPFPGNSGSPSWKISSSGGQFPVWSRDRRELLYHATDGSIMVAGYTVKGDTFQPEKPRPWSNLQFPVSGLPDFDLSPDGKRLAVPQPQSAETAQSSVHVTVLLNYFDELRRRMPVK